MLFTRHERCQNHIELFRRKIKIGYDVLSEAEHNLFFTFTKDIEINKLLQMLLLRVCLVVWNLERVYWLLCIRCRKVDHFNETTYVRHDENTATEMHNFLNRD